MVDGLIHLREWGLALFRREVRSIPIPVVANYRRHRHPRARPCQMPQLAAAATFKLYNRLAINIEGVGIYFSKCYQPSAILRENSI